MIGYTAPYNEANASMYCRWADGEAHDMLTRDKDGKRMYIGWAGSSEHETSVEVRSKKMVINGPTTIQGFRVPEMQHGNISLVPSAANTPTSLILTFDQQFSGQPDIVVSANTQVPGTAVTGVGTTNRSKTGCTIWVTRTNTTETNINWIAMY